MKCHYACQSVEHLLERRRFLGTLATGAAGAATLGYPRLLHAAMPELVGKQKHILVIYLAGGLSQLESWDPKPGTDTGGPFRAIPTSVPGLHICELLPHTAKQMHHLAVVRSVNTKEDDHGKGAYCMTTGRRKEPVGDYPHLGAVGAKMLAPAELPLPGHVHISSRGSGGSSNNSAFLGPKYASIVLGDGNPPENTTRPENVTEAADQQRNAFRAAANDHFARRRRTADSDAFTSSFEQARQLMERREVFDVTKEPAADLERYGTHEFGRHCLLARRLLEQGVSCVQVNHSNYDTHYENFDFHIEQLGEFDRTFATLVADFVDRGLWKHTLLVVMAEFGRTPKINNYFGRDHWGRAWSVVLGGGGIQPGAVIGKTNANGTEVSDREVDHGHLFHTYLKAVGVDPSFKFDAGGRPIPIADPAASAIDELLAEATNDMSTDAPKIEPQQTHQVGELKHSSPLLTCRFDPAAQHVFASAHDFSIQRWNIADGKVTPMLGHGSWVWTLAFHPSGSTLYSGGYEGRVIFWEPTSEAPQPARTIEAHDGWVRAVAVSPDGNLLATAGNDNLVKIWSATDGAHLQTCIGHANHVYNVAFHPTLPVIVSGDLKGVLREWDIASGEQLRQFDASALWKYDQGFGADIGGVRSIAISRDGKHLACGGITEVSNAFAGIGSPIVVVFDLEKGEKLVQLATTKKFRGVTTGVLFHPDGFVVGSTSGHDGGHLLFWKLDAANEFFDLKLPDSARGLDLDRTGARLATAGADGKLRLWQMTAKAG